MIDWGVVSGAMTGLTLSVALLNIWTGRLRAFTVLFLFYSAGWLLT